MKVGITKGTSYKDAIKRSSGFKGYEIRIQNIIKGTLEEVFNLEQTLHKEFSSHRHIPAHKFGGHTELFSIDQLRNILSRASELSKNSS